VKAGNATVGHTADAKSKTASSKVTVDAKLRAKWLGQEAEVVEEKKEGLVQKLLGWVGIGGWWKTVEEAPRERKVAVDMTRRRAEEEEPHDLV